MQAVRSSIMFWLAVALTVAGAVNWGLLGVFRVNFVSRVLGRSTVAERAAYTSVGLAGVWLGLTQLLPRVLVALRVRSDDPMQSLSARPLVRQAMPSVTGTTLSGARITIPRDALGKVTFLAIGFSYDSRFDVEDWSRAFREQFGHHPDVLYFEVAMIGGIYRFFAPAIDEGMRRGSPSESYDHVITVYASQRPLRQALRAGGAAQTWVYLLDAQGRVLFQQSGSLDVHRFQELSALTERALAGVTASRSQEIQVG